MKITDFGTVKYVSVESDRKASFVGTAEYCSPELLNDKSASYASDVWALGCMLYQFLVGRPPFKGSNEYQTFQRILGLKFTLIDELDVSANELISRILVLEPERRPSLKEIKTSDFFKDFNWSDLHLQEAPVCPVLEAFSVLDEQILGFESLAFDDSDEA